MQKVSILLVNELDNPKLLNSFGWFLMYQAKFVQIYK